MPDIGHAEAGSLPDRSELTWKCDPPKRSAKGQHNGAEFLSAGRKILDLLSKATGKGGSWADIEQKLGHCFEHPAKKEEFKQNGGHKWRAKFPHLDFHYDESAWFDGALKPKGGFFDLMGDVLGIDPEDYRVLGGREYFHFHAAAKQQREAVRRGIEAAESGQ